MKFIKRPKKTPHFSSSRISFGIGTVIVILLAFSCVVGADSFLTDSSMRTEGENYDMISPEYYETSEEANIQKDADLITQVGSTDNATEIVDLSSTEPRPTAGGVMPPLPTETSAGETKDLSTPSETTEPDEPSEPTEGPKETTAAPTNTDAPTPSPEPTPTPKPTHAPTPTATPVPTPTPKPEITEKPKSGTFYAVGEVNVRKGPGTSYEITRTLQRGDPIEVVAVTSNGWYRTIRDTYVLAELCTPNKPATPTPPPKPTPTPRPTPAPKKKDPTPVPTPTPKPKKDEPTPTPKPKPSKDGMTLIGDDFKITFYGPQQRSDGSYSTTTATGTKCTQGRTIAADWNILPAGTVIYIENDPLGGDGYYTVEDRGGGVKGHHIDIYADDGESGRYSTLKNVRIYIVNG